uniref:SH3 domain-binding protein 5-like n=1 Tax=Phallusia mammillata TaxID=59560 RepID=A0A6F9DSR1_9ASCI|nr:SH3 domain-binding protein 5-like [Phallusia mammillata]
METLEINVTIKAKLECLNSASERINVLENTLTEKRNLYRTTLTESTQHLNAIAKRVGDSITKARPYFDAKNVAKQALQEAQKAAIKYERAVSMHNAAREMVFVAEQGMIKDSFDTNTAWPDMLNHATNKVNEAEIERMKSEEEHLQRAKLFKDAEQHVKKLEKNLKSHVNKSQRYFEEKEKTQRRIQALTEAVNKIDETLSREKCSYSQALQELESISECIHAARQTCPKTTEREPGVGAESVSCNTEVVQSLVCEDFQPVVDASPSVGQHLPKAEFPEIEVTSSTSKTTTVASLHEKVNNTHYNDEILLNVANLTVAPS